MSQASPWGLGPWDRNSDAIIPVINLCIHSTNTLTASAIGLSQVPERQQRTKQDNDPPPTLFCLCSMRHGSKGSRNVYKWSLLRVLRAMKIKLASVSEGTVGGDVGADVSPVKIEVGRVGEGRQRDVPPGTSPTTPWLAS